VFFEPRLGKSKVALDWAAILALKGEIRRVLILAPRIALDVWEDQIHQHFSLNATGENFEERWVFDTGKKQNPAGTVVSFWLASREEVFRATRKGTKLQRPKQVILEDWRPDAVIVDESHEYKRPGGRGAQDAWRLVERLRKASPITHHPVRRPYVLLLSGTPNPKGWRDVFAQYRIMDQSVLGTNSGEFDGRYCIYGQGARKYTIIRYQNLEQLKRLIHSRATTCTAVQAGLEGELFFQTLRYNLPQKVRVKYEEMVEEFVTELDGELLTAKNQGVKRLRLLQIAGGFTTDGGEIHDEALREFRDWLHVLHTNGECVVCAARFLAEVRACGMVAKDLGFDTAVISGATSHSDRSKAIRTFQKATRPSALVFQVQSGSRAIELSNAAEVVFYSLPDGWVDFFQFLNRVRGPNQRRPVRVSTLVARGTVATSVLHNLRYKEDIHGEMMKSPTRYLRGEYYANL
jgi:hypothetical protein